MAQLTVSDVSKIAERAVDAVQETAARPTNPLSATAVAETRQNLEAAIEQKVATTVAHVTNNEPWYQSRVTIGNYLAIAGALAGVFGVVVEQDQYRTWTELIFIGAPIVAGIVGSAFSLYGRWKAKKPLFSS